MKFKVFVRQLNKKLSTELGYGSINIRDIVNTTNLSNTLQINIVNKGIKIGELKVTIELGCDFIHFGKEFVGKYNVILRYVQSVRIIYIAIINTIAFS